MKLMKVRWALVSLSLVGAMAACGSKDSGGGDGDGDGDNVGGDGDGDGDESVSGDGDGDSLDQGTLAANCASVNPSEGDACDEPGLVCSDASGSSCVCGGFSASAGDGDNNSGRPGRPGSMPVNAGSGQWECFSIGVSSSGGSENMGGDDGTGGDDGSGGRQLGGQGGAP